MNKKTNDVVSNEKYNKLKTLIEECLRNVDCAHDEPERDCPYCSIRVFLQADEFEFLE